MNKNNNKTYTIKVTAHCGKPGGSVHHLVVRASDWHHAIEQALQLLRCSIDNNEVVNIPEHVLADIIITDIKD